ncbi:MFS transporter [Kitasatospora sp. NPDC086801]|uniref:MFS transporter n=1 Tax=Kitasatospora sp. NPDC086801 TaxID=3364066 RepID=UPI00380C78A4
MSQPTSSASAKPWIGLAVLVLPALLISTDLTVLNFALPSIAEDLHPTATTQLWMIDIYGFALSGLLVTMGALGDRIGRRRLLLTGVLLFSLASVLAAYSHDIHMLIAARALQGIGGATVMPSSLALIRNLFQNEKQRGTAIVVWSIALTTGVAIGPLLGGLLLSSFWWGSVFLINVPFMLLLLVIGPLLLPEFRDPNGGRLDLFSVALSLAAVFPVIYGLKRIAVEGFSVTHLVVMAIGLALGVLFLIRQARLQVRLIDIKLFRNAAFTGSVGSNLVAYLVLIGFSLFGTQYLQLVLGMSPLRSALWTLPGALAASIGSPIAIALARSVRRGYVISAGFLVSVVGFVLLGRLSTERDMLIYVTAGVIMTVGLSAVLTLITDMAIGAVPAEKAGAAAGLVETGQEFGGAIGIALLGSIGASVYHQKMAGMTVPGLPVDSADAAHQSIGGAFSVASRLPASAGSSLTAKASESFVDGLHTAAYAAGGIALLAAVVFAVLLRRIGPTPPNESDEGEATAAAVSNAAV